MKFFLQLVVLVAAGVAYIRADSGSELQERKVNVGESVSLRVIEAGNREAQPVLVFIPGWSTGADIWRHQIDTFAKTYWVIAFDPRSEGESTKTTSGNTPENRARDLCSWTRQYPMVLMGWLRARRKRRSNSRCLRFTRSISGNIWPV